MELEKQIKSKDRRFDEKFILMFKDIKETKNQIDERLNSVKNKVTSLDVKLNNVIELNNLKV